MAAAQNVGRAVTRNLATQQGQSYWQRFDQRAGAKERRAANAPVSGPRLRNFAGQRQAPSMLQNSVSTGMRPEMLYSQQHMQRMANRDFGQAMAQADPRLAQKQFMGRGLSLDAGTLAAATPQIAEGRIALALHPGLCSQTQTGGKQQRRERRRGGEFLLQYRCKHIVSRGSKRNVHRRARVVPHAFSCADALPPSGRGNQTSSMSCVFVWVYCAFGH